jgi:hypothetical protein
MDTYLERSVVCVDMCTKTKMKLCSFIAYTLTTNLHSVDDIKLEIIVVFPP